MHSRWSPPRQLAPEAGQVVRSTAGAGDDVGDSFRNLSALAPKQGQEEEHRRSLAQLSDQIELLEKQLAGVSQEFREQLDQQHRTPEDIRKALPADAALVDLLEYTHYTAPKVKGRRANWQRRIAAFVVRHDAPIARIELGPTEPIRQAVETWRAKNLGNLSTDADKRKAVAALLATWNKDQKDAEPGLKLREWVWSKLQPQLTGAKTVLLSPDGPTARFPWPALPGKEPGTYLIEDLAIAIVPIPRLLPDLLATNPAAAADSTAKGASVDPSLLLVGEVNFDADPGKAAGQMLAQAAPRDTRDGEMFHWPSLPGTRTEIVSIADSFEQQFPDSKMKKLRGDQPTKAAVGAAQLATHRYLHLATHGFFAPPGLKSTLAGAADERGGGKPGSASRRDIGEYHPGLLSGLVLAGANQPAAAGKDDGILTALEVSQLDLSHVELATLSACETGLGDTAGGEGFAGLATGLPTFRGEERHGHALENQ